MARTKTPAANAAAETANTANEWMDIAMRTNRAVETAVTGVVGEQMALYEAAMKQMMGMSTVQDAPALIEAQAEYARTMSERTVEAARKVAEVQAGLAEELRGLAEEGAKAAAAWTPGSVTKVA